MGVPNISLTTNAQLITKDKVTELVASGLTEITLSVHGVSKEMYEKFMPGATYERLLEFLRNLKEEKRRLGKTTPHLRMNYTANPENLPELKDFFTVYGDYDISMLQIRPVMKIGGVYNELFEKPTDIALYGQTVQLLKEKSKRYKVSILANTADIVYETENKTTPILEAVYRYISPNVLWEQDFDWQNEDYYAYCKRIGWDKWLWANIFKDKGTQESDDSFLKKYAGRYEVVS